MEGARGSNMLLRPPSGQTLYESTKIVLMSRKRRKSKIIENFSNYGIIFLMCSQSSEGISTYKG